MDRTADLYLVETTETRDSTDGKTRARFKKGDRIPKALAARFGLTDDPRAGLARTEDEQPDIAETDDLDAGDAPARAGGSRRTAKRSGPTETAESVTVPKTTED